MSDVLQLVGAVLAAVAAGMLGGVWAALLVVGVALAVAGLAWD